MEQLIETRKPEDWQVEQWGEGLNWFFREAPTRRRVASKETDVVEPQVEPAGEARADGVESDNGNGSVDGRRHYAHTLAEMQEGVPIDPWFEETVRLMRVRHMAYRTEEAYLGWIRRMERFFNCEKGLEAFGQEDLKRFLSYLAVEEGVAAGTQRQALNAGVFFLREVRKMERIYERCRSFWDMHVSRRR
ncbi:site-specific integrase [Coraliomargarita sp. W4R53]